MKSVVFVEPNRIEIRDQPIPELGNYDVLVKVHACGICGTDIHILRGEHIVEFPVVPGHEFSGEVVQIGANVDGLQIGDRVTVDPNIVDHTCYFCSRGETNLCENLTAIGVNRDGGFAEYCRVPARQAYKIPEAVSLDEAALAEPLACCLHGIERANIRLGATVVVLGAGSAGLMLMQLARISGAGCIIVSEPDEFRRNVAGSLGADVLLNPHDQDVVEEVRKVTRVGADVVIESAGRSVTAKLAVKLARRGGTILQFGMVSPNEAIDISPYDVYYRELTITGSFVNPFTHARAVELLASKRVNVLPLITHRFPLSQADKALDMFGAPGSVKILLFPE
jgi:2-desacetyl-2-hydroxyethyl bacteriochlorophyllide A dehydrogenase